MSTICSVEESTEIKLDFTKSKDFPNFSKCMNILNLIKPESYYCQIHPSLQKTLRKKIPNYTFISKKLGVSITTVSRILNINRYWINFKTLLNLSNFVQIDRQVVLSKIIQIKTKNSFPIDFNINNLITPSFFRIIGHILGDGGIHIIENEGKYRAFYTNNEKVLLNSFTDDVKKIFGKVKIYRRKREVQADEIWLPTTLGYLLYNLLGYKELNKEKRVPLFILNCKDKKLIGAFLQAFYDDDGYLYPQKNMILISQKRIELINEIRQIVRNIGIKPNQLLVHKSKNKTTMHYFSITHKDNIKLYNELIGFKHPLKKKKLNILINKYEVD